jgi:DNA-directed RNA polymerase subunit alpha
MIEDVTEVVLNLKEVVLDIGDKEQATLRIDVKGPATVTAGMLEGEGNVKVVNPDRHICSLNNDGHFKAEFFAKAGRGYVVAEANKDESFAVNTIFIDAAFSPVTKVNHVVTNARVGQRTDYDKLVLEVWTDGSISPEDAVKSASYILRDQLNVFAGGEEVVQEEEKPVTDEKPRMNENLYRRIDEIELSVRSSNCLENADIKYIGELVQRSEAEMLRTKNFGRKSLNEIKEILGDMGLSLGMRIESYPSRAELDRMYEQSSGNTTGS